MPLPISGSVPAPRVDQPVVDAPTVTNAAPVTPSITSSPGNGLDNFEPQAFAAMASGMGRTNVAADFALIPGRYPGTVGLPDVLNQFVRSPEGQAAISHLFVMIKAQTGVEVPAALAEKVKKNPNLLLNALELSPADMKNSVALINQAYHAGKLKPVAARQMQLPQKFDFATYDGVPKLPVTSDVKQIAPGLYQGDDANPNITAASAKANRVMAETLQRLAHNPSLPAAEQFEVTYQGAPYTSVTRFIEALKADGFAVKVAFVARTANFGALKVLAPGSTPEAPRYLDVAAPLMMKTGHRDASGKEALLPSTHSAMTISMSKTGSKLNSNTQFYQGTTGTGFFASDLHTVPAWLGMASQGEFTAADAVKAIDVAGVYTNMADKVASQLGLYAGGYGVSVCNDSVAAVEQVVRDQTPPRYPLMMQDSVYTKALTGMLADGDTSDDARVRELQAAIAKLPSDADLSTIGSGAAQRARALASIPYPAGQEPFGSTVVAKKILSR